MKIQLEILKFLKLEFSKKNLGILEFPQTKIPKLGIP